jgi:hypothetical protein
MALFETVVDGADVEGVLPAYHCRFPSMTSRSEMDVFDSVVDVDLLLFLTPVTRAGDTQDSAREAAEKATSEDRKTFILFIVLRIFYYNTEVEPSLWIFYGCIEKRR